MFSSVEPAPELSAFRHFDHSAATWVEQTALMAPAGNLGRMWRRMVAGVRGRWQERTTRRSIGALEELVAETVRRNADGPAPTLTAPISQPVTWSQVNEPGYAQWLDLFGEPAGANRKVWEWAWICQSLDQHFAGVSHGRPTAVAGFGVGTEPIVGWMASQGHQVLATDLPSDDAGADHWASTNQLAADRAQLDPRGLATSEQMTERVTFRAVDMRDVPDDLGTYDAIWSSCAIEHLGSLEAGLDFVRTTLRHCRPGGLSVHTTELNVSHEDHTVDSGHTVVYRRRDLEAFFDQLRAEGHEVLATFNLGSAPEDRIIDTQPWGPVHLKMVVGDVVATSFGFSVKLAG